MISINLKSRGTIALLPLSVHAETNIGGGNDLSIVFDERHFDLVKLDYWAKAEWNTQPQSAYYECHPVGAGVAKEACPHPVQEVGMNGQFPAAGERWDTPIFAWRRRARTY